MQKRTKNETEATSLISMHYLAASGRAKILTSKFDFPLIGFIEDEKRETVEISDITSGIETVHVPTEFHFRIKDVTNKRNGELITVDAFSITQISRFD